MTLLWTLLIACGGSSDPQAEVEDVVAQLGLVEGLHDLYVVGEVGEDTVVQAFGSEAELELPAGTLYFADLFPEAKWSHEAELVVVTEDGDLWRAETDMFPVVDEEIFYPNRVDPVFGLSQADVLEDDTGDSDTAPPGPPPPADTDECNPEATADFALTLNTWPAEGTQKDERTMRNALWSKGFTVTSVRPSDTTITSTLHDLKVVETAMARFAAMEPGDIDEFVFYYTGHGARGDGELLFGNRAEKEDGDRGTVPASKLAGWLADIPAQEVTVILDSCYSGQFARRLEEALGEQNARDKLIRVLTASDYTQTTVSDDGSRFTLQITPDIEAAVSGAVDWDTVRASKTTWTRTESEEVDGEDIEVEVTTEIEPQRFEFARKVPLLTRYEYGGDCIVADIDHQSYHREVSLRGDHFGELKGRVEMQGKDGKWVPLEIVTWWTDLIQVELPMRADGFPSDDQSADILEDVDGRYLLRVVRLDDLEYVYTSQEQEVQLLRQKYQLTWTPTYYDGEIQEWTELWHPLSAGSSESVGATILQSRLSFDYEATPFDELDDLDFRGVTEEARHETVGELVWADGWSFELEPGERDLATAYEQSDPDALYWGFRAGLTDEYIDGGWTFTLIYD